METFATDPHVATPRYDLSLSPVYILHFERGFRVGRCDERDS